MFFLKNVIPKKASHFLMLALLSSFIVFFSSFGGGGKGDKGGGDNKACEEVRNATISLIFPTLSQMPGRRTTDPSCIILPISLGSPMLDFGATSIYQPNLYYCKITVRGSCPNFIREYVWRTPTQNFPIQVPDGQSFSVVVNYYEPCNNCNSLSPGRAQLAYKEDFGGSQSLFTARLNYVGAEPCN